MAHIRMSISLTEYLIIVLLSQSMSEKSCAGDIILYLGNGMIAPFVSRNG